MYLKIVSSSSLQYWFNRSDLLKWILYHIYDDVLFPKNLYQFTSLPTVFEKVISSHPVCYLVLSIIFNFCKYDGGKLFYDIFILFSWIQVWLSILSCVYCLLGVVSIIFFPIHFPIFILFLLTSETLHIFWIVIY